MNYFEKCTTDNFKARYKELSLQYHPDRPGGDTQVFQLISAQFKEFKETGQVFRTNPENVENPFDRRSKLKPHVQPTSAWETFFGKDNAAKARQREEERREREREREERRKSAYKNLAKMVELHYTNLKLAPDLFKNFRKQLKANPYFFQQYIENDNTAEGNAYISAIRNLSTILETMCKLKLESYAVATSNTTLSKALGLSRIDVDITNCGVKWLTFKMLFQIVGDTHEFFHYSLPYVLEEALDWNEMISYATEQANPLIKIYSAEKTIRRSGNAISITGLQVRIK